MRTLFLPAIALMNRLDYARKFMLLALVSMAAFSVVAYSLFASLNKEISVLRRELEGIRLIGQIPKIVQPIQQHRGLSAGVLGGVETMRGKRSAKEKEVVEAFHKLDGELPPSLASGDDWRNIKANWERLQKKGLDQTQAECFAAHTRLIGQILVFEVAVADEYALTLDPEIDTYYLIDTIVNKLPHVIENLAQLRAQGVAKLADRQVAEPGKMAISAIIGKLGDALGAFGINIEKAARYDPALQSTLLAASGNITGQAHQIIDLVESDILAGRFTASPENFYVTASAAIDANYSQMQGSLLSETGTLIKTRLTEAENTLHTSVGIATLLLLGVTYFAIGIYYSIIGNVRSLGRSARAFADGNMGERVRLGTSDELGRIGDSFNEMASGFNAMLEARNQAEESMRKSEEKFRAIYESSSDGIMLLDENGFFDCNEAALRVFGCSTRDDVINKHPSQFSPLTQPGGQDSTSSANEHIATAFKNGSDRFEWMHCRLDGTEFFANVWLTKMELNGGPVLQATVRDITVRKQAEEGLRKSNSELEKAVHQLHDTQNLLLQSDKMASVGQLAAGVAHEINNPIGYVGSNLGTLDGYLGELFGLVAAYEEMENAVADDAALARVKAVKNKVDLDFLKEDVLSLMRESQEGLTRVKKIVQDLKDFSRVDSGDEWHRTDLHKGLDSTLNVARNEIKYKADVKKEYGDIPEVECVISQLNQVFMNLLVNAAHAIEEHGTITLRTGQQGDEVWVEVADTGKGIAPEHLNKIFDPFFTTKPVGKGTGLGLSLSYGIIQKHHGRIEANSEAGKGASFKVWLPVNQPRDGGTPQPQGGLCPPCRA
ncbi:MAG: PAS domain S-box protein [Nitrosomonadales bacterium]|nr:PAS domain S-box protein [Nitrosomonadales bacterium]